MSDRAAEYRKRADDCMAQARQAYSKDLEQQYLKIAESWLNLARRVEQEAGRLNPPKS